ncbi:MAG: hypothetical protein IKJ06_02755 [Clostridia bacterium]|nr:hypothetical protein [Clostridia bacterium]
MKMWLKILSVVLVIAIAATAMLLFTKVEKECCLCSSFRYHAPCLIDLETGKLIELDLYFPHPTLVAELSGFQPEQGTFSFVCLGNVVGTKLTDSKTIEIHIPNDKTYNPALCSDCRKQLPLGQTSRYTFADLYKKEEKILMPIKAGTTFSLRCYDVTTEENTEKGGISVVIQGTLGQ